MPVIHPPFHDIVPGKYYCDRLHMGKIVKCLAMESCGNVVVRHHGKSKTRLMRVENMSLMPPQAQENLRVCDLPRPVDWPVNALW